jgi:hypothetical protein
MEGNMFLNEKELAERNLNRLAKLAIIIVFMVGAGLLVLAMLAMNAC